MKKVKSRKELKSITKDKETTEEDFIDESDERKRI